MASDLSMRSLQGHLFGHDVQQGWWILNPLATFIFQAITVTRSPSIYDMGTDDQAAAVFPTSQPCDIQIERGVHQSILVNIDYKHTVLWALCGIEISRAEL